MENTDDSRRDRIICLAHQEGQILQIAGDCPPISLQLVQLSCASWGNPLPRRYWRPAGIQSFIGSRRKQDGLLIPPLVGLRESGKYMIVYPGSEETDTNALADLRDKISAAPAPHDVIVFPYRAPSHRAARGAL